ncbi:MAG TPA: ATPase, T2SS/T4P/T4SS family [Oligoflexia bacterium]|nr:ATPase, T2SS/T4P/T4SS family [Oligoflexia bacterium]HMP48280.1 ATPase, T2SS/T4P/T4SS family [Oligoflexia bacterium]
MYSGAGRKKKFVSIDDIRSMYERNHGGVLSSDDSAKNRIVPDLTASAKFVVKEAKKILGNASSESSRLTIPSEEELDEILRAVERSEGEELSSRERHAAIAALSASLDHYDILSPLIQNPEVNDIIVRSYRDVSIQIGRKNIQTDITFSDHDSYKAFVESLLKRAGKSCTVATPVVDAAVDPNIRASVTHESLSPGDAGPMLTLRISRFQSITLDGLEAVDFAPREIFEYLTAIVRLGCGAILIGGEVGTGKTTLVRALSSSVDESEAILVIEDTNEINLQRKFVRTLLTREGNTEGAGRVSPAEAIRAGMRMAMNRIILGEIRDGEAAEAFVDVCASGHPGMSTIHARTGRDAVSRMELFLARAQGDVGIDTIRRQISNAISVVVYAGLDNATRRRRIMTVHEVSTASDGIVQMAPIFEIVERKDGVHWVRSHGVSQYYTLLSQIGVFLPNPGTVLHGGYSS